MSKKEITMNHKCGDCSWFSDGYCRKLRQSAGFFTIACDDFALGTTDTAPASDTNTTKVCKTCGRALPLSAFGGHHRTADHLQASCKECMNAKIKKAAQTSWDKRKGKKINATPKTELDEILDKAEPMPIQEPRVVLVQTPDLSEFTPQELYDELCRRGWSGTLTKVETLQPTF